MKTFMIVLLVAVLGVVLGEYPADFPKCKNSDETCLSKAAADVFAQYNGGSEDINLDTLDPINVDTLKLERNPSSPVNIELIMHNCSVTGLKGLKINYFKGLNADLKGRTVLDATVPELRISGQYNVDGRVLILPIAGNGYSELLLKNCHARMTFSLKPITKDDGQTYAVVDHMKIFIEPEATHFRLDNLFNGNAELSNEMNKFINENSNDVYKELQPSMAKAMANVLKPIVNKFLMARPYAEHFL